MTENNLIGEKKGSIYTISLNRPAKRNAINVAMFTGICELAEKRAGDAGGSRYFHQDLGHLHLQKLEQLQLLHQP